jgi:hypothetical protein
MLCDNHKAERIKECLASRSAPNYKPRNPNCTHGMHQEPTQYGKLLPGFGEHMAYAPCEECHYCGQIHPWQDRA